MGTKNPETKKNLKYLPWYIKWSFYYMFVG